MKNLYNSDGSPKYVRLYEAKRASEPDRWTVVFTRVTNWVSPDPKVQEMYRGRVMYLGMTKSGAYYHGEHDVYKYGNGAFGSRIAWDDLTEGQKKTVLDEYKVCWGWKGAV